MDDPKDPTVDFPEIECDASGSDGEFGTRLVALSGEGNERASRDTFQGRFLQYFGFMRAQFASKKDLPGIWVFAFKANQKPNYFFMALNGSSEASPIQKRTIGSDEACDFVLDHDEQISPKHVAMVGYTHPEGGIHYLLWDLRSTWGMLDGKSNSFESMQGAGPSFYRVGGYILFFFPTDHPEVFRNTAEASWEAFPACQVLEEAHCNSKEQSVQQFFSDENTRRIVFAKKRPQREMIHKFRSKDGTEIFMLQSVTPNSKTQALEEAQSALEDPIVGTMIVHSFVTDTAITYAIGKRAAQRGILLGRNGIYYNPEEHVLNPHFEDNSISRKHALILMIVDKVYIIDLCSLNGVKVEDEDITIGELTHGIVYWLGPNLSIEWRRFVVVDSI